VNTDAESSDTLVVNVDTSSTTQKDADAGVVTKAAFDELASAVKTQTDRFDRLLNRMDQQDREKVRSRLNVLRRSTSSF
jgi:hypothetical protein